MTSFIYIKGVTIDIKEKISFFKEYNEQENYKKEKIYEQFFYFIGLLSLQTTFVGYYLLNLPEFEITILCGMFVILLFISLCIFLYVYITSILNFLNKGIYAYLPEPHLIKKYIEDLENSDNTELVKTSQFNHFLLNKNIQIASNNTEINIIRQQTVVNIRAALVFNILVLTIAFIPYTILSGNKLNSHKVILLENNTTVKKNHSRPYLINIENIIIKYDTIKDEKLKELNMEDNQNKIIKDTNVNNQNNKIIKEPIIIEEPKIRMISESFEKIPEPEMRLSREDSNSSDIIIKDQVKD